MLKIGFPAQIVQFPISKGFDLMMKKVLMLYNIMLVLLEEV